MQALADTPERVAIRDAVGALCAKFDDDYWLERDRTGTFAFDFHKAFADAGWLGIAMPEQYGGAGLGITEAAIMMQTGANSAGVFAACSTIHPNVFGPHAIVVPGTDPQKARWLPALIKGEGRACRWRWRTASARRARAFAICSTASIPSASSPPPRRSASVAARSRGRRNTPRSASSSAARSARTRRSSTRSPRAGPSSRPPN